MRIAYCTNVRLPSERAHGHQIAQVCDALIGLGHEVTVFSPFRKETIPVPFGTYYGVSDDIKVQYIGHTRHLPDLPLIRALRLWLMNHGLRKAYTEQITQGGFDLVYTRTPALLSPLLASGVPVILELHQLPHHGRRAFVRKASRCVLTAALTSPMRSTLLQWNMPESRVIAEGDGVDLRRFVDLPSREAAQKTLGISTKRTVVGYVGRLKTLGMDKGVSDILKALAEMKDEQTYMGLIVGGPEADKREYEALAKKLGLGSDDVAFTGEVPGSLVSAALAACDVLAMPFPDRPHYRKHMSPLKMFEYMAAGRPLVTSDLPTVRDVLNPNNAVFCQPGDVHSLSQAFRWITEHPEQASRRAVQARKDVERHTWEERMKRVLRYAGF